MIEHTPWRREQYKEGLGQTGQRICIIGYSHYKEANEDDADDFTIHVLTAVSNGTSSERFFTCIRNYFEFDNHLDFWRRVLFFNYVPHVIGNSDNRFGIANEQAVARANERCRAYYPRRTTRQGLVFYKERMGGIQNMQAKYGTAAIKSPFWL